MSINREWHAANRMPKKATVAQRIAWHLEHQQECACRPIPRTVQAEIKKQGQDDSLDKERMSEKDRRRWLKALAESKRMRDEMLAERGGRPWTPSEVLLEEAREERI